MYNADLGILPVAILGFLAFLVGIYFARKESRDRHARRSAGHTDIG